MIEKPKLLHLDYIQPVKKYEELQFIILQFLFVFSLSGTTQRRAFVLKQIILF